MATKTVLKAVRYLGKCLEDDGLDIAKIILFGSQANATARVDSDVDIVIVSTGFDGKDIFERAAMLRKARIQTIDRYIIPMDIILKTPEEYENAMIALYAEKGKVVFKSGQKQTRKKEKVPA